LLNEPVKISPETGTKNPYQSTFDCHDGMVATDIEGQWLLLAVLTTFGPFFKQNQPSFCVH
jgi:hypothetical protein